MVEQPVPDDVEETLHVDGYATAMSFNRRGTLLAVGCRGGECRMCAPILFPIRTCVLAFAALISRRVHRFVCCKRMTSQLHQFGKLIFRFQITMLCFLMQVLVFAFCVQLVAQRSKVADDRPRHARDALGC